MNRFLLAIASLFVLFLTLGFFVSFSRNQPVNAYSMRSLPVTASAGPAHLEIPAGRPAWVDSSPSDEQGVHRIPIASEPFATVGECEQRLDELLVQKSADYVDSFLGYEGAARLLALDAPQIRERYIRPGDRYDEELGLSIGPMHQVHLLVNFDQAAQQELRHQWRGVQRVSRLTHFGLWAATIALSLGAVFGFLRFDLHTRGLHRRRWQFLALTSIMLIIIGGLYAVHLAPML